MTFIDR